MTLVEATKFMYDALNRKSAYFYVDTISKFEIRTIDKAIYENILLEDNSYVFTCPECGFTVVFNSTVIMFEFPKEVTIEQFMKHFLIFLMMLK